jgi:hypothetical protein
MGNPNNVSMTAFVRNLPPTFEMLTPRPARHQNGVAVAAVLEVDSRHHVDPLELVRGPRLGAGVLPAEQQRREADPGRGQAIALQDALEGLLEGGGQTLRAFSVSRMAVAPTNR